MKRKIKLVLLGLIPVFLAIQFIRPAKNLSAAPAPNDITAKYPATPEVKRLLAIACYDCHSNNTRYPWYAEVQPVGWWLASHVSDAKRAANFSDFATYSVKRQRKVLDFCTDTVTEQRMPLASYKIIHVDARLTPDQIRILTDWFDSIHDQLDDK